MDKTANRSLVYLPWAEYQEPVTLGKITIFPFNKRLVQEKRISDRFYRYLEKYFRQFVKNVRGYSRNEFGDFEQDKPLGPVQSNVSIVAYSQEIPDFFAEEQIPYPVEEIRDSVALLSLLATWDLREAQSSGIQFSFSPQNWEPRDIAYTPSENSQHEIIKRCYGGYLRRHAIMQIDLPVETRPTTSTWKSEDIHAHRRDSEFLECADLALQNYGKVSQEDWFRRLIRAIRICNRSLTNADFHDRDEMIGEMLVLLVSALNSFCHEEFRKPDFVKAILRHLGCDTNAGDCQDAKKFLENLYDLRSKYVHGVPPNQFRALLDECIAMYGDPYPLGRYAFGLCCKALLQSQVHPDRDRSAIGQQMISAFRIAQYIMAHNREREPGNEDRPAFERQHSPSCPPPLSAAPS